FFEEALNQNPKCAEAYLGKLLAETKCVTFDDYKNALIEKYADANSEKLTVCDEGAELVNASVKDYVLEGYLYESTIKDVFAFDRSYDSSLSCRKSQKNKQLSEIENDKLLSRVRQYATGDTKKIVEDGLAEVSAILDRRISDAQKEDADAISEITGKYKTHLDDAYVKVNDLRVAADKKKYSVYESYAKEMTNARTANEYSIVRDKFLALKDYKNAAENAQKCQSEIDRIKAEERQKKERLARKAKRITLISISAVVAVIAVIIIIMKIVIPTNNYNKAISFKNNGQYSEAIAAFENLDGYKDSNEQIIICQTALKDIDYNAAVDLMNNGQYNEAISAFEAMDGYRDSQNQIEACQIALKDIDYITAVELMNNGQYDKAITAFYALDGYKDSDELIESIKASSGYISTLPVGTLFKYGSYKDLPLVWIILENNDGKIFAITNNVIEQREYNSSYTDCTWETCNLRMWLNNNFYDTAFTEEEQARIISTDVSAESGNSTQDKIYIMSVAEAEKYFTSDDDRIGRYNGSASLWWLRTPGRLVNTAAYVFTKGNIFTSGYSVNNKDCGVRPVMWISLES
ncbi:MAG: DUF6273 domain-containing protein, partial [Saccharofermentans sp.]|nr:DUF6273 domain-containing protein [Saccharofermentans sp.]